MLDFLIDIFLTFSIRLLSVCSPIIICLLFFVYREFFLTHFIITTSIINPDYLLFDDLITNFVVLFCFFFQLLSLFFWVFSFKRLFFFNLFIIWGALFYVFLNYDFFFTVNFFGLEISTIIPYDYKEYLFNYMAFSNSNPHLKYVRFTDFLELYPSIIDIHNHVELEKIYNEYLVNYSNYFPYIRDMLVSIQLKISGVVRDFFLNYTVYRFPITRYFANFFCPLDVNPNDLFAAKDTLIFSAVIFHHLFFLDLLIDVNAEFYSIHYLSLTDSWLNAAQTRLTTYTSVHERFMPMFRRPIYVPADLSFLQYSVQFIQKFHYLYFWFLYFWLTWNIPKVIYLKPWRRIF